MTAADLQKSKKMSFRNKTNPPKVCKCLPKIPFEVLIGCFQESERVSFQSASSFYSNAFGQGRRNTFSGKSCLYRTVDLRTKFEEYLYDNLPIFDSEVICQKLQFLDIFCESMKIKGKPLYHIRDVFSLCNTYLYELIKGIEQDGSVIIHNNSLEYSFLKQFSCVVSENEELLPVFSSHEYLKSWFSKKQKELLEWKVDETFQHTTEEYQDDQLGILITMFVNQMHGHFLYFQEKNSKYCKKWMQENITELPKHLFECLKSAAEKTQKYRDHLAYSHNDGFSIPKIIDADFEIIHHLSNLRSSSWKMLSISKLNEILSFSSTENFTSCPKGKIHKFVYYEPYNILQLTKAMLSYKYDRPSEFYKLGECQEYQKLDVNNSSKKYSTVVMPVSLQLNSILPKRQTTSIFATKAKFINTELVETTFLYKSCNSDTKNPYLTLGGFILQKDDTNRTRIIDSKMYHFGGILQTDFALSLFVAKSRKELKPRVEWMMEKVREKGFVLDEEKELVWRTFCEYCREYFKVDPNELE
ncbi:predicted protein [Naegleria gruberi]|uniref:Predicted protein n=1 Tax=Naegleria gruberi TaxID=5762 RepID=D2VZ86_NAEGR|nr:uncharacterized protein NAEGRDRAFT_59657 [Naegleria gruberi]EFC37899.1 predicted protein [Naegleria gruberi]|eukprot:XP_002670643.1 predicted protein [Naegleria gruberi strain NEG-M]